MPRHNNRALRSTAVLGLGAAPNGVRAVSKRCRPWRCFEPLMPSDELACCVSEVQAPWTLRAPPGPRTRRAHDLPIGFRKPFSRCVRPLPHRTQQLVSDACPMPAATPTIHPSTASRCRHTPRKCIMNDTNQKSCNCANCPGATCTCGCQAPAAQAACACGPQCKCGPACACPKA